MQINIFYTTVLCVSLSACVTPKKFEYVKQGASQYEKTNAKSECQYQIELNKTPIYDRDRLLDLCMQGKGYRYVQTQ